MFFGHQSDYSSSNVTAHSTSPTSSYQIDIDQTLILTSYEDQKYLASGHQKALSELPSLRRT